MVPLGQAEPSGGITVETVFEEPPQGIIGTTIEFRPESLIGTRIAVAAIDRSRCIRYSGVEVSMPGVSRLQVLLRKLPWPVCH
jgi:hypothetical protein